MNDPFKLHKLTAKNTHEVFELEKACFPQPWTLEQISQALMGKNYLLYGISNKATKELLAYLSLQYTSFGNECELEILNVATKIEYRNKGLGARLLHCMIEMGKELNCTQIFLEVRISNKPAIHLYHKIGFVENGRRKAYYTTENGKEDALLMSYVYPKP